MTEELLKGLNEPQREAVLDFGHNLLVLAGAGSGKTRVITTKIALAISAKGYAPWRILGVTFTNKAANEMRTRIASMLGPEADLSGLEIRTFHSYGASLLRRNAEKAGLPPMFNIYDDSDSMTLLASANPGWKTSDLKPYLRAIMAEKERGRGPGSEECAWREEKLPGFRAIFRSYQAALSTNGCVDFPDLINRTNETLERDDSLRESIRRRYRLVLVDEYQDSNAAQFRLLENIVGPDTQLVVVGDDDQSIYRFRGAELKNILTFSKSHENVRTIKLEENYRSTKNILRVASSVIRNNRERHKKTIFTNNPEGPLPRLLNCADSDDEAWKVASDLERRLGEKDTAILYRTNAQSRAFEQALTRMRVPYQVVGALRFYEREEVKDMLSVFSLLLNPRDQVAFRRIVNKPARGVGATSLEKVLAIGPHCLDAAEEALKTGLVTGRAKGGLEAFLEICAKAREELSSGKPLALFAADCARSFGFENLYKNDPDKTVAESKLQNISALAEALQGYPAGPAGLASFLETLTLDTTAMPGEDSRVSPDKNVVKLITMHNTKGLEFDSVYVTGLEDGTIPGQRSGQTDEDVEEERRIFYVAVTRAREDLTLTWSASRMLWGDAQAMIPSRFLKEIPDDCYEGELRSREPRYANTGWNNRGFGYGRGSAQAWGSNVYSSSSSSKPKQEVKVVKKANKNTFRAGDKVWSPDYGDGEVVQADVRDNGKTIIRVAFRSGMKGVYNAQFCNLEKR